MNTTEAKKKFIVLATDTSDTANGIPEKIAEYETRHEAEMYVVQDMRDYCDNWTVVEDETGKTLGPRVYDEAKMYIENYDGTMTCQWQIVEA